MSNGRKLSLFVEFRLIVEKMAYESKLGGEEFGENRRDKKEQKMSGTKEPAALHYLIIYAGLLILFFYPLISGDYFSIRSFCRHIYTAVS